MKKRYQRISLDERIIIEKQLALGLNHSQIAVLLSRSRSSVYREVKRCKSDHYCAMKATCLAVGKSSDRKNGKSKMNQHEELFDYVKAIVLATGSTFARTRLYRIGIANNLTAIEQDFIILGLTETNWEPFRKNVTYHAFSVRKKNRKFEL